MSARPERRRDRRRDRRRAARAQAGQVMSPEAVPLHLPVAGLGVRLGAQITDLLLTGAALAALLILLAAIGTVNPNLFAAVAALSFFAIRIPYYVLTEILWNGQTLGKRLMKIKVIAHDGGSLTTHALVVRNMMKEAEVFFPATLLLGLGEPSALTTWLSLGWVMMTLAIPLLNPYRQRLGDMLAGTHVIHLPEPILLADLAQEAMPQPATQERFVFLAHQLDHYGAFELQTLEGFLRAQEAHPNPKAQAITLEAIVIRIRKKIDYPQDIPAADRLAFLRAFYKAQRAHLEQRQLFGDRRADKHHGGGA